ncbi:hypothetical protein CEXT_354961 [Caerostris extrusa]|uniref:Uncharacterized protein n=1 Tax=Caerostris extrusa TaxID=172846 RepID=A0AAV4UPW1_CAEEX|nr:hypothetical protein CEXT_354961 [Caerostris extrusa]
MYFLRILLPRILKGTVSSFRLLSFRQSKDTCLFSQIGSFYRGLYQTSRLAGVWCTTTTTRPKRQNPTPKKTFRGSIASSTSGTSYGDYRCTNKSISSLSLGGPITDDVQKETNCPNQFCISNDVGTHIPGSEKIAEFLIKT